jgi:hypothetical protein
LVRGLRLRGVDQVFRVEAVELRGLVLGSDVSQRGDGDRKGGEALLAVHNAKVAEIMQSVRLGLDSHRAADEVPRHVAVPG